MSQVSAVARGLIKEWDKRGKNGKEVSKPKRIKPEVKVATR